MVSLDFYKMNQLAREKFMFILKILNFRFSLNTHPSHNLILKYTDELNRMPYRQKFPRLEPKNVQFWFKNRRAKCKRLKMSLFENQGSHYQPN